MRRSCRRSAARSNAHARGRSNIRCAGVEDRPIAGAAAQVAGERVVGSRVASAGSAAPGARGRAPTATSRSPACRSRTASRGSRPSPAAPGAARRPAAAGLSTVNSALPSSVGHELDAGVDRLQRDAPSPRELADDHRAGAAVAFGAAFLGAGAPRVLAQQVEHRASSGRRRRPRRRRRGGRSGSVGCHDVVLGEFPEQ